MSTRALLKSKTVQMTGMVFGGTVITVLVALWRPNDQVPPSTAASPAASIEVADDAPLLPRQIGELFSQRIAILQASISICDFIHDAYTSKMKQDVAFANLESYRADSETMKNLLQAQQKKLSTLLAAPGDYSDDDAEYFDVARELTDEIVTDHITMAVGLAVEANFGMGDDGDMEKAFRELRAARKKFNENAMAAYKKFGYERGEIDQKTLIIRSEKKVDPLEN